MHLDDTIVAISTPPGRGGIGVVRLSGPEARAIVAPMLRLKRDLEPGRAVFGELIEPASGERLDEVVVTFFEKPHSYTTDDVVEISTHGAPVILRRVVELALERGARLAEPGEFTMRAFLNGRLDLTQAEAVRDLIESQTLYQAKVAAQQLDGALSHRLQPIKQSLVELIALLEAGIDFAEDDVSVLPAEQILARMAKVRAPLAALEESFSFGKLVHEGFTLAIVGRPNVGKSSLFNRLVERERAIVTASPGTTRDLVSETVSLDGIPVRLVDTAGIRNALDEAESIGVRKSLEALADADLALVVLDASASLSVEDHRLLALVEQRPAVVVENKCDLADARVGSSRKAGRRHASHEGGGTAVATLRTSALTGEGIAELRHALLARVGGDFSAQAESGFLTNVRHQSLVSDSLTALDAAERAVSSRMPHEMLLLDLYSALRPLDAITGATTADDILDLIVSRFCIGK
ncbi:MAG: tRNA uridine-5-carboxymethylaminomethyl(34) synthesis GTPase MnmE [Burkholderiales bacterium]